MQDIVLELNIFRWLHVLAMAWWLGGEWGVFHASTNVANSNLNIDERKRALAVGFQIDILPRSMILVLPLLGIHMAALHGISPITGYGLMISWIFFLSWIGLVLSAFYFKGTAMGWKLTMIDERIRYVVIPLFIIIGIIGVTTRSFPSLTIFGEGAILFEMKETSMWFALKVLLFGLLLCIGLALRIIMRRWVIGFQRLAKEGSTPEVESYFAGPLAIGRKLAYIYWMGIATVAFFGVTKIIV
ncbi:MAG: hypothetical protein QM538_07475 [Methylacidiphilales bacterium]|nr:hypothetical protein [Candidatus Methylacidiphilales bacterium]